MTAAELQLKLSHLLSLTGSYVLNYFSSKLTMQSTFLNNKCEFWNTTMSSYFMRQVLLRNHMEMTHQILCQLDLMTTPERVGRICVFRDPWCCWT